MIKNRVIENRDLMRIIDFISSNNPTMKFNEILHGLNIVVVDGNTAEDDPIAVISRAMDSNLFRRTSQDLKNGRNGVF